MANTWFNYGREQFAVAGVNWLTDRIDVGCLDTTGAGNVPDVATAKFYSEVQARVVASTTLTGKDATDGVLSAASAQIPNVTGNQFEALVIWKNTGDPTTSPLLIYIDTAAEGLPLTPNGGGVRVDWNAQGIARL